jgi:hypothetical protein
MEADEMIITPIKNPGEIPGGCVKTVLGTAECPACGSQVYVEVANVGDHQNLAWFIYHERLGGGYCPGSESNVEKLQAMEKIIKAVQNLGFVIADIINYDPAGEVHRMIAYLSDKALYMAINFENGELISSIAEGQLQYGTRTNSKDFCKEWTDHASDTIMGCSNTQAVLSPRAGAINGNLQGKFFWTSKHQEWFEVLEDFVHKYKKDISRKFKHPYDSIELARSFVKYSSDNNNDYSFKIASEINQSIINKFPEKMFDQGICINTIPK